MKREIIKASLVAVAFAMSSSVFASNPNPAGEAAGASYHSSGPYSTTNERVGSGCRFYRPTNMGTGHPILVWGNGTGGTPGTYGSLLSHLASHGIVVAAATTSSAGSGAEMVNCYETAVSRHNASTGTYSGRLNPNAAGASGHSQGGGGSIMAARDSRITVTAPMQPYVRGLGHRTSSQSQQNGRMFLMTGSSDTLAGPLLNGSVVYGNANVPVFWGNLDGAGHFEPTGNGGDFRGPMTAFLLYHLAGDEGGRDGFYGSNCGLCSHSSWEVRRKNVSGWSNW